MPSDRLREPSFPVYRLWPTALLVFVLTTSSMPAHAIEEPDYTVARRLADDIELRQYAPYTVAELTVAGPADEAGRQAFPVLADYIFGKNQGGRKLPMTAPVTQAAVPVAREGTAPITQSVATGGFLVQFALPKGLSVDSAPAPQDPRIRLRDLPPADYAVIRYSGFWSDANYAEHLSKLQAALRAADLTSTGEAVYARYDAPFIPWFLRRNEIWLRLTDRR